MIRPVSCLSALVAAASLAVAVTAQAPQKPGSVDRARVTAGTYTADPAHTLVGWRVDHFGFNDYFGLFGDISGTLTLDPANPAAARVDVTIPVNPTVASSALRDHLLRPGKNGKAPDFFGASPEPARFVSRTVRPGPDGASAHIIGDLTLNGRTMPVAIDARFSGAGVGPMNKAETVGFEGKALIRRSDFGIGFGIPMVSDEVELDISAAFEKTPRAGFIDRLPPPPLARPDMGPSACGANRIKPFVGRQATPAVRTEVARTTGAKAIRWITPGMAVTMDYRTDRLNVSLTKAEVIEGARCG